jgi:hypothetical protein
MVSLGVTVTPSDCTTCRLRPPRPWYDALLGGPFAAFIARADAPTLAAICFRELALNTSQLFSLKAPWV